MRGELSASMAPVEEINLATRREMYALFELYYDAVTFELFDNDLSAKRCVLFLKDSTGKLRGFTTLQIYERSFEGRPFRAVFSGDTIIHHEFRGDSLLVGAWMYLTGRLKAEAPAVPLYWFLIVKGDKTYRYLPGLFKAYYPAWDDSSPPEYRAIAESMAVEKYGENFDREKGIVRFPQSLGHLKSEWADPRSGLEKRHDVRFFLEKNPGYRNGDELVCLTELSLENMRPLASRPFAEGLKHPYGGARLAPAAENSRFLFV